MEQQYGDDFISITDEDGKEYELEVLAELEHDGSRYLVALYRADRFSGTLRASDEGRVFWVERSEFARMNVIWNMKDVLRICDGEGFSELYWDDARPDWVLLG